MLFKYDKNTFVKTKNTHFSKVGAETTII